ncbi:ribokinase [Virgibacillus natechei]|uniref:Ribokinase n=1 Tax=Virgibacillus natechei TaxID=1216297 RepID=A0ABS4IIN6_9BACI|nr:ribokinase [Virgibacillus natechei]MBP1970825.1 ribokinase [Virgibacillus natechei]UZD12283.1 ribokinase [Virgibacillus natechei]
MKKESTVCVVGSINMDLTISTEKMPEQGETILGGPFATYPGGKGANQAVAAARVGANVNMIGAVGDDAFGVTLLDHLKGEGINAEGITMTHEAATGIATIILSENDNRIIVAAGANNHVLPELVDKHHELIKHSDVVLMQLEIPMETVARTLKIAGEYDVPVVVNPAPYQSLPDDILTESAFFTPNEIEVEAMKNDSLFDSIREKLIITKGDEGVAFYDDGADQFVQGFHVEVKDTTGAGDTFNGALAACLGSGLPIDEAVQFANAAAALSVTKVGAQGGMPTSREVEKFIR